jgi:hypothetical protein
MATTLLTKTGCPNSLPLQSPSKRTGDELRGQCMLGMLSTHASVEVISLSEDVAIFGTTVDLRNSFTLTGIACYRQGGFAKSVNRVWVSRAFGRVCENGKPRTGITRFRQSGFVITVKCVRVSRAFGKSGLRRLWTIERVSRAFSRVAMKPVQKPRALNPALACA